MKVKDIKKSKSNFNALYQIKFLYIRKFDKKALKIDEIIPDSTFKNELIKIKEEKIINLISKTFINQ